jgi:hypothetical protein
VISKPSDIMVVDWQIKTSIEKQFAFCGIYSGNPYQEKEVIDFWEIEIIRRETYNVGVVRNPSLVKEIIEW